METTSLVLTQEMIDDDTLGKYGWGAYVTDASDLGIGPGEWPQTIQATIGNGQPFVLRFVGRDGAHHYSQQAGCLDLIVLND